MDMDQTTKITLAWELYEQEVPKTHIAQQLMIHRDTVHRWLAGIEDNPTGLLGFLENYLNAKKGERAKRKVDGLLKKQIYRLREDNRGCCGQKIKEYLEKDYGISLSTTTIYKVLAEKYILRSRWKKNQKRGPVPKAAKPREVVQMDTVDFGRVFAFTGVDIFAKDVSVKVYPTLTSRDGRDFLVYSMERRFKHVALLQTDGGPEFKDEFQSHVLEYAERHRIARPYRKNEQSFIEAFNRSLRKECLGWSKYSSKDIPELEKEIADYLVYYHSRRPHLSLAMKTPNEILRKYGVSDF